MHVQGVSKKLNLFDIEYLKDDKVKLIVLLGGYSVLPYNSIKPNLAFYGLLERRNGVSKYKYDFQDFIIYITNGELFLLLNHIMFEWEGN